MSRFILVLLPVLLRLTQADQECQGNECPVKVNALLQSSKRGTEINTEKSSLVHIAKSNRDHIHSLHSQTKSHHLMLSTLLASQKALPDSIAYLVEAIKNHSAEVKAKLVDEHAIQSADLDEQFAAITTCDANLSAHVDEIEGSDPDSPKSVAAAARDTMCDCQKQQAKTIADETGRGEELACLQTIQEQTAVLVQDSTTGETCGSGTETDLVDRDHYLSNCVDLCSNSAAWQNMAGATNDDKALAWFESQKQVFTDHWNDKIAELEALMDSEADAAAEVQTFEDQTASMIAINDAQIANCTTLQSRATMDQCYYHAEKNGACATYTVCRDDAEAAWTAAVNRETVDSEDRKNAWVASTQIECIIGTIAADANGTLQIDDSVSCDGITCDPDSECASALDLSVSLARTWDSRAACTLPDEPCAAAGWNPTCATDSWGSYTPAYFIGSRTAPDCSPTPQDVTLATYQTNDACAPCSDS